MELKTIAKIHTDFSTKFGVPRQSGLAASLCGTLIFEKEYRNPDSLRGLENYSHIWIIWGFNECFASDKQTQTQSRSWSPTVRPPRLGGNVRMGIFATRSPNRPNPIGLSCVKIESIEKTDAYGTVIHVSGIDMMNGSPVYDIKPYLPHIECIENALGGFAKDTSSHMLNVSCPDELLTRITHSKRDALLEVLSQDPRPAYINNPKRIYGFHFDRFEIKFTVDGQNLYVTDIEEEQT